MPQTFQELPNLHMVPENQRGLLGRDDSAIPHGPQGNQKWRPQSTVNQPALHIQCVTQIIVTNNPSFLSGKQLKHWHYMIGIQCGGSGSHSKWSLSPCNDKSLSHSAMEYIYLYKQCLHSNFVQSKFITMKIEINIMVILNEVYLG